MRKREKAIFLCVIMCRKVRGGCFLVTQTDISSVVDTQRSMTAYFQKIYLIILCIGFPLIFALSRMITGSIKKVGKAARRISRGKYSERIRVGTKDEIGQLAADFNQMAEKIEEIVRTLRTSETTDRQDGEKGENPGGF